MRKNFWLAALSVVTLLLLPAAPVEAAGAGPTEAAILSPAQMKALFDAREAAQARKDVDSYMSAFHREAVVENVVLGTRSEGLDAIRTRVIREFGGMPPYSSTNTGFAYGDNVMVVLAEAEIPGASSFMGSQPMAADGRIHGATVLRFKDGLIVEEKAFIGLAALLEAAGMTYEVLRAHAATATR